VNRKDINENFIFRFHKCGLSLEKTSHLCDVSQKTVEGWDKGKPIPSHHRKLMELYSGLDLGYHHASWKGWKIRGKWIISPYGDRITMEQIMFIAIRDQPSERVERARRRLNRK
jgi:hypothetical protein